MDPARFQAEPSPFAPVSRRMAIGGMLLALLGWYLARGGGPISPAIAVAIIGGGQAAIGLASLLNGRLALKAARVFTRCAEWLGVRPVQLLMIVNGLTLALAARSASGDEPLSTSRLAIPIWLIAIALVCFGCWSAAPREPTERWTRAEIAAVACLTILALGVRAWSIATMPYVLSGDEGSAGLTAWEFRIGTRNNLLSLGWFSFPSLYFGLASVSQALFGRTTEAIRLVSALAGGLTIPALYWMARPMLGRPAAFAAAAWLAAFHMHVFFSRLAYNNVFDGLLFALAAGGLWRGWQDADRRGFVAAGLALGFSQFFYTTSRLTPLVLGLWAVLLALNRKPDRARLSGLLSTGLIALAVLFPLALLYAANPGMLFFTASRVSMLVPGWTSEAAAALGTTSAGLVLEQIWVTALGLTVAELQGVYYAPGVPMLISVSAVLFLLGLVISTSRCRNPRFSLLLLVMAGTILMGGLSIQAPNSQRLLYMSPALALMVVLPLEEARGWSARRWPGGQRAITVLAGFLLVIMLAQNIDHLFRRYFPREEYGSLNGAVTQAMIEIWPSFPPDAPVYFFGGDRMGFASIPSITYLRPEARATDVDRVDLIPAQVSELIAFVLPDEIVSLNALRARFHEGIVLPRYNRHGRLLFHLFATGAPAQALSSALP